MISVEDKKRFWPFLLTIPLAAASVVGWFILPEELVMQIGVDGQPSSVMPKLFGLLIPWLWGQSGRVSPPARAGKSIWQGLSPWRWRR